MGIHYHVNWTSAGCLPDSSYVVTVSTRRELTAAIRDALEQFELPASHIRKLGIRDYWRRVARIGSASCAHFSFPGAGLYSLNFDGLTDDEAAQLQAED